MEGKATTLVKELQSKKKDFTECKSSKETMLTREWNKAIDECIKVVMSSRDPDVDDDYEDWDDEIYDY